ncbi:MAG: helix-turn-helix domain-containing protein [Planctomycetes bacterium]|nr:helix-turn-helix domain-containing protein [Planctomycetota bacterium]
MLSFSSFLCALLEERKLSGRSFARLVDGNQSYVSKILRGSRPPPDGKLLLHWADQLALTDQERRWFLVLADLETMPPRLLPVVRQLILQAQAPRRGAARAGGGRAAVDHWRLLCDWIEQREIPVPDEPVVPRHRPTN